MEPNVLLIVPTGGSVQPQTMMSIYALCCRQTKMTPMVMQGRPIDYVRNNAVRIFLDHDKFTHLFFVDSDIELPLGSLDRLLALECSVASGVYPIRFEDRITWSILKDRGDKKFRTLNRLDSATEPLAVDACGGGCLLLKRDVFDELEWPWFKWIETAEGIQMSEDVYFCRKLSDQGFLIHVDPQVMCGHRKEINLMCLTTDRQRGLTNGEDQRQFET